MNKISNIIVKYQKTIVAIFLVLALVMTICVTQVKINYNMQDYLPEGANSTKAIEIMQENFNDSIANTNVLVMDVTIDEALEYKEKISKVEGVEHISWLDGAMDLETLHKLVGEDGNLQLDYLDDTTRTTLEGYYKDRNALFQVTIESGKEQDAVNSIYEIIGEGNAMNGSAVDQANSQNIALTQSVKAIMLIGPLIIILLILATTSWIEPFIYLSTIGIAVIINLGINIFRGSISYVTLAVAPLLQLAVSLDYAVFLSNSFDKYRRQKIEVKEAMKLAMKDSLKSISASALTTLFGFVALMFMDFKIGPDMGFSLVIGVILSFVAVLTLLPALILCTYKLNDKCKHKPFLPSFRKLSSGLVKVRIPLLIVMVVVVLFSYNAQKDVSYIYGSGEATEGSRIAIDTEKIESTFGHSNMIAILVPVGNHEAETNMYKELEQLDYIKSIISYANTIGFEVPLEMVPESAKSNFYSDKYARIILSTTLEDEGKDAFDSVEEVKGIVNKYYDEEDVYMCGNTVNMFDMKTTIENDNKVVSLITIVAIFLVLLFEFKSLIIPVILILSVKGSIWITMALSGMSGDPVNYLGYLVVSTVMMGATIDYAILITDNYIKIRKEKLSIDAIKETLTSSIKSILVSASTLAFAGFTLGLTSSENVVKSLGLMLGEGTVVAFIISITLLPGILVLVDKLIPVLSLDMDFAKENKKVEVKEVPIIDLNSRRIICINREYGSGGHEIGKKVAEKLNIPFYDSEILEAAVEKLGIDKDLLSKGDEKLKGKLLYTALYEGDNSEYYGKSSNDILFDTEKQILLDAAKESDAVMVGRCSSEIIRNNTNAKVISIFISANLEDRIKRKMKQENKDEKIIIEEIKKKDKTRSAYYKYHTGMEWASPSSYDFTLNTSSLGIDRTVDLLVMSYNQMKVEKNNIKETKSNPDDIKGGLKKVTDTVVDGYTKIENGFVKAFLRKNGETVEEAKARLKEEEKRRREKQRKYLKSTEEIQKNIREKYGRKK